MYLLKIKGTSRISDYVQIRDEAFTLIAYFKANKPEKAIIKFELSNFEKEILDAIKHAEYGKIFKINN